MDIKTFDQLTTYDERVMHMADINPATGLVEPITSPLVSIQRMVADCDLALAVPAHVRAQFDACRKTYMRGCFDYELFTVAEKHALLTLEAALGARFLTHYPSGVPLEDENSATHRLQATYYDEVTTAMRRGGTHPHKGNRKAGWIVQDHPRFNGSLKSLLGWARAEKLLRGQRNRVVEGALYHMRNRAAHPHGPSLVMPGQAAGIMRDIAEIINHLWGRETPNGRLYPTPLDIDLFYVHWFADGSMVNHIAGLRSVREGDRESAGPWALIEAVDVDEAHHWSPRCDTTMYPTRCVWFGDSWNDAVTQMAAYRPPGRQISQTDWMDRTFAIRLCTEGMGLDVPRSPAQFRQLAQVDRDTPTTRWLIARADHAGDVAPYIQYGRTSRSVALGQHEGFPIDIVGDVATWAEADALLPRMHL